uniref:Uncharacterized protein n=1 Tax=Palpitomonas bilix TaxID=652834 RepID=A0A7S3LSK5_9EUKA
MAEKRSGAFQKLGLRDSIVESMDEMGIKNPTSIQNLVMPKIIEGGDVMFASETGSGKTLAFLSSAVERMKRNEAEKGIVQGEGRPSVLVLSPSRELAMQTASVSKEMSRVAKYRSLGVWGGVSSAKQRRDLKLPVDVLVGTPRRVLELREKGSLFFSKLNTIILDEADTLLSRAFEGEVKETMMHLKKAPFKRQFVLSSATITPELQHWARAFAPNIESVTSTSVHQSVPTVKQDFVELRGYDRHEKAIEYIEGSNKNFKTIAFVNSISSCRAFGHFVQERGVPAATVHGDMPAIVRERELDRFLTNEVPLLVSTDLFARGMDFRGVHHIVNVDFPKNAIDYLHRIGRTARAGKKGFVTNIVGRKDAWLSNRIQECIRTRTPLHAIDMEKREHRHRATPREEGGASKHARQAPHTQIPGKDRPGLRLRHKKMAYMPAVGGSGKERSSGPPRAISSRLLAKAKPGRMERTSEKEIAKKGQKKATYGKPKPTLEREMMNKRRKADRTSKTAGKKGGRC